MQQVAMKRRTAADVLRDYSDEELPLYLGKQITDVNQRDIDEGSPLHLASMRGVEEDIVALLEGGADVNLTDEMGYTALHWAALNGHLKACEMLLEHGADPRLKNEFGFDAENQAELNGHSDVLELLRYKK